MSDCILQNIPDVIEEQKVIAYWTTQYRIQYILKTIIVLPNFHFHLDIWLLKKIIAIYPIRL